MTKPPTALERADQDAAAALRDDIIEMSQSGSLGGLNVDYLAKILAARRLASAEAERDAALEEAAIVAEKSDMTTVVAVGHPKPYHGPGHAIAKKIRNLKGSPNAQ